LDWSSSQTARTSRSSKKRMDIFFSSVFILQVSPKIIWVKLKKILFSTCLSDRKARL